MTNKKINNYVEKIYQCELAIQGSSDKDKIKEAENEIIKITNILVKNLDLGEFLKVAEKLEKKLKFLDF